LIEKEHEMEQRGNLTLKNILGYGMAALAYNFVYTMVTNYVNIFFTNVVGIGLAAVGVIMLVARIWDGVNDPIMGTIVDKTRHPQGKYRMYMLWGMIPLAAMTILVFINPNFSMNLKVIYAAATYILWGMAYTFANIPYMAMQSTLSFDSDERTKIITLKNIFVLIGAMVPTILVPMLAMNEEGTNAQGFLTTGIIGAVLVIICMFITFKATAAYKYVEKSDTPKITWGDRAKAIFSNKPLILLASSIFALSVMMALNGVQTYFVLDVLGKGDLVLIFSLVMMPGMLLAMAFMPIAMKFEKRTIMIFGSVVYAVASIIWFFVPNENITIMLVLAALRAWGLGFGMILMWSMLTDCVDYAKLKTGKQQGGIVFSTTTFMQKAAGGIGIGLLNLALVIVGFVPGASTQTAAAGEGVKFIMTIGCAVLALVVVVLMIFYPLSKAKMKEIAKEIGSGNGTE